MLHVKFCEGLWWPWGESQIISLCSSSFYSSFIPFIPEAWPPLSEWLNSHGAKPAEPRQKSPLIFSALEMTVVNYKTWACFSMEKKNHTELTRKLWFYLFFWEILWKGVIIILEIMSYKNVWSSRHPNPSRFLLSWSAAKSEEQIPFMMYVTYEKKIFF